MAATHPKPSKKPRWGTTTTHITEPSEGKKDLGWAFEEIPPSDVENWRAHTVETWFDWIDERIFDGASADELLFKSPGNASDALKITDTEIILYKDVDFGSNNIKSNWIPATDNTYDLGSISLEWKDLFIDGIANIDTLVLSITAGEGVGSSLIPSADDAYDLGAISYEWKDLFIDGTARIDSLILSTSSGEGVSSDLIPSVDDTYSLGGVRKWKDLWIDGVAYMDSANISQLIVSSGVGEGVAASFNPLNSGVSNLGTNTRQWQDLWCERSILTAAYPIVLPDDTTPSNPDSTRTKGTIAWDASYLYIKTADTDGWKRIALTAF